MGMFDTMNQKAAPGSGNAILSAVPNAAGQGFAQQNMGADQFQQKQKMRANPLMRGRPNMNRQVMNQPAQGIPRVRPPVNNTPLPPMQGLAPTQLPANPSAGLPPIQTPLDRQNAIIRPVDGAGQMQPQNAILNPVYNSGGPLDPAGGMQAAQEQMRGYTGPDLGSRDPRELARMGQSAPQLQGIGPSPQMMQPMMQMDENGLEPRRGPR